MSKAEETLNFQCMSYKMKPSREHKFHPKRRWRFDFAWPDNKLAVEIEGGIYSRGRHTRPTGYIKDMEKYNEASKLGWTVLRFTPMQVKSGMAILQIREFLGAK